MRNLRTLLPVLLALASGACNDDTAPPDETPGAWVLADCARAHDVTTHYRNTAGQTVLRVTRTQYFEDLPDDPQRTLVRTCNAEPTTTEWGCPIVSPGGQTCIGDEAGPWPLCNVAFASTDAEGTAIAVCGERVTREVVDGPSGQVTQTTVTESPVTVYLRAN